MIRKLLVVVCQHSFSRFVCVKALRFVDSKGCSIVPIPPPFEIDRILGGARGLGGRNLWKRPPVFIATLIVAFFLCREFYLNGEVAISIEDLSKKSSIVRMTRRDAGQLTDFFTELMISESLIYTLAGKKPLSFTCCRQPGSSFSSFSIPNLRVILGWRTWKKYRHHFENPRIKFWKEKSPWVKGNFLFVLADIKQCQEEIEQNYDDFTINLGQASIDAQEIFCKAGNVPFFKDILNKHDALIGILLGYGRGNSWLYYNRNESLKFVKLPFIWDSSREQEISNYYWKYITLQKLDMSDLLLPIFVGDPDSAESEKLKKRYLDTREKIKSFYKGKDFLSATLSLYKHGQALL